MGGWCVFVCVRCTYIFKVLIIQFYVFLFTDKLQRVAFLIFSRNLRSTNLKSDYEYAFSQYTYGSPVSGVAKRKMHHSPCCIASWICELFLFFIFISIHCCCCCSFEGIIFMSSNALRCNVKHIVYLQYLCEYVLNMHAMRDDAKEKKSAPDTHTHTPDLGKQYAA